MPVAEGQSHCHLRGWMGKLGNRGGWWESDAPRLSIVMLLSQRQPTIHTPPPPTPPPPPPPTTTTIATAMCVYPLTCLLPHLQPKLSHQGESQA
ncbi:unnamed protein product [Closterium sp. NIES-53]